MFIKDRISDFMEWTGVVALIPDSTGVLDGHNDRVSAFFMLENAMCSLAALAIIGLFYLLCLELLAYAGLIRAFFDHGFQAESYFVGAGTIHELVVLHAKAIVLCSLWFCFFVKLCHISFERTVTTEQYDWCLKAYKRLGMDEPSRDINRKSLSAYVKTSQKRIEDALNLHISEHENGSNDEGY